MATEESPTCGLCSSHLLTDTDRKLQMCRSCASKLGVVPMPPRSRPAVPCAKCNSRKFVRVIPREHTSSQHGDSNSQVSAPMYLTHSVSGHHGWILSYADDLDTTTGHGMLEIYACWGCGAVEWYCNGVRNIPIHPHLMTELVDYDEDAQAPYR